MSDVRIVENGMAVLDVPLSWGDLFILTMALEKFTKERRKACPPNLARRPSLLDDLNERMDEAYRTISTAT